MKLEFTFKSAPDGLDQSDVGNQTLGHGDGGGVPGETVVEVGDDFQLHASMAIRLA